MTEKAVLITDGPPSYPGVTVQQPGLLPETFSVSSVKPQSYLGLAFAALLCCWCCWPAGIFAIIGFVFSAKVDSQHTNKDFLGARRSSYLARNWSIAAIATGLLTVLIYFSFRLVCHLLDYDDDDGSGDMD